MSVEIRAMVRSDTSAVLDMLGRLNEAGTASDPRYRLTDDWREWMRAHINDRWLGVFQPFPCCFVAEADGGLVGYVQGDIGSPPAIIERPPTVRIGNMWVEPEWRRQGIAKRLVETYVGAAREAGFPWVEVGTLAKDARAVAFWRAMGFDDWRVSMLSEP